MRYLVYEIVLFFFKDLQSDPDLSFNPDFGALQNNVLNRCRAK